MKENLKDILSHLSTEVDQETLLLYLQGKLTPEKQHELEKQLLDSEFHADALEGLQHFENKSQLSHIADQLNRDLKKKTIKKKTLKNTSRIQAEPWLVITMIILLLLVIISYFIILKVNS